MLVDIVQTFDEQAFESRTRQSDEQCRAAVPRGDRAEQEREALMSAMVMGPAMPGQGLKTASSRTSNRLSSTAPVGRVTSNRRPTSHSAPAARPALLPVAPGASAEPQLRLTARGRAVLWL